jgi:rare lipoprotein A
MMSIELVPLLAGKPPDLGTAWVARGVVARLSRILAGGALLTAVLVAGSASAQAAARASSAKTLRAEANGGNPQVYEVFGKRYRVRESSDGYREQGIASWYGHPFHGRKTSNGEIYDMNEMTAAHTTLPLPTWVEVTNLTNGKRIIVKVNDRGPFVGKRVIDLSYAAANALDMVRGGTAKVEVRALEGPPPTMTATTTARRADRNQTAAAARERVKPPAPAPQSDSVQPAAAWSPPPETAWSPPPSLEPQAERLFAQAGRFTKRGDAVQLVDRLKAQGIVNAFVVTEDGRRRSLHRVRVGPLPDDAEVERMSDRLRGAGGRRSRSVVMP